MHHRGPDASGEWWSADGGVGLGHRRLAIIDLSPAGNQPMTYARRDLCIVFNGEIYNFKELRCELEGSGITFRTESDTEVILAAYDTWGTECLPKLHGMFAFALYDGVRKQIFLARDRCGEKPLFYREAHGELRFASELKALLADRSVPRKIDRVSMDTYLNGGFSPSGQTMLTGISKLPPAHAMVFDLVNARLRAWRYWHPPAVDAGAAAANEVLLLDDLSSLLESAVRHQLVADVPVGVLLSGGIDSSLVTAMAARSGSRVRTFNVRFPGEQKFDETEHARIVSRHFGTEHSELDAEPTTVDLLATLATQFDEPLIDSSMIPTYLVSRMIRKHCTVALGGDGGDELFGGYSMYDRLLRFQKRTASIPFFVRQAVAEAASAFLPIGYKGRNWLQALTADLRSELPVVTSYFDENARRRLLRAQHDWPFVAESLFRKNTPIESDLVQRATRMDFEQYLSNDILVKVDRSSMLSSLEVRAPFLDTRVVEFAFRDVPSALKASPTSRKILLKKLASRMLPPDFNLQRKQGFSIPLDSWLQSTPWQQYFRDVLLDDSQRSFDHAVINELFRGHERGRANGERLFGLVMFELWKREYGVQL
jgi:asparagine synthase (glutamine-hydrolysing)